MSLGENIFVPKGLRLLPSRPFEHLQLDYIQLKLCMVYKNVFVIEWKFSRWIKAFPYCETDALTMVKKLLENVFSPWGIPSTISNDQGTHLTGQII